MPIRDEAINVFMGLPGDGPRLELTYNFGVDRYELGTGYNHIAITARRPRRDARASSPTQGIEPEKPPYTVSESGSRLCFVRDPDGYRIELIERPTRLTASAPARTARLAVVDLGSNSFRLVVFSVHGAAPTGLELVEAHRRDLRAGARSAPASTRPARSARRAWRGRSPRPRSSRTSAAAPA